MPTRKENKNTKPTKDFNRVIELVKEIGYANILIVTLDGGISEGLLHGDTHALVDAVMGSEQLDNFRGMLKEHEVMASLTSLLSGMGAKSKAKKKPAVKKRK